MKTETKQESWKYEGGLTITTKDGFEVAYVNEYASSFGDGRHEANARLIAAAPELLEACQTFVVAWEKSQQLEKTDVALRKAKLAIQKATQP